MVKAWNLLADGMGGFDWSGLPIVATLLGFEDVELLVNQLLVIKGHAPKKDD